MSCSSTSSSSVSRYGLHGRALPELVPKIDPWRQQTEGSDKTYVGWFSGGSALLDIALGGALVAVREAFDDPTPESVADLDTDRLADVIAEGGSLAVNMALDSLRTELEDVREQLQL